MDVFEAVRAAREVTGVPGAAVGVLEEGTERHDAHGRTSLENPLEVTPETRFQVGSITKTFTGTAICELVANGVLDLDRPVREYLPDLALADADATQRVTLRHLLSHTGGWFGDYFDDTGWGDDAAAVYVGRMRDLPQQTPVGELWAYNNAGFALAGRVVEVVTGKTFEDAVQQLVFDPLELESTTFWPWDVMTERFAGGAVCARGGWNRLDHARPAEVRASASRAAAGGRADAGAAGGHGGRGGVDRPDLVRGGPLRHDPPRRRHQWSAVVARARSGTRLRARSTDQPLAGRLAGDQRGPRGGGVGGGRAAAS